MNTIKLFRKPIIEYNRFQACRQLQQKGSDLKRKPPTPVKLAYASLEGTESYSASAPPATPLIIHHGLFGSKGNWSSMSKALHAKTKPKRRIISVDARNHGDSPHAAVHTYEALALDVLQFLDDHKIDKASLLGHSMGGRAMMMFALKWPERVDNLFIADISPVSSIPDATHTYGYLDVMASLKLTPNLPLSTARIQADNHLARVISNKGIRAFLLTNLVQQSDGSFRWRINIPVLHKYYKDISSFPSIPKGQQFVGRTVFIAGGTSDFIQKSDHKKILELFPKAEFRTVEGAGHWLHSEKPYEFLSIILEFLNHKSVTASSTSLTS